MFSLYLQELKEMFSIQFSAHAKMAPSRIRIRGCDVTPDRRIAILKYLRHQILETVGGSCFLDMKQWDGTLIFQINLKD